MQAMASLNWSCSNRQRKANSRKTQREEGSEGWRQMMPRLPPHFPRVVLAHVFPQSPKRSRDWETCREPSGTASVCTHRTMQKVNFPNNGSERRQPLPSQCPTDPSCLWQASGMLVHPSQDPCKLPDPPASSALPRYHRQLGSCWPDQNADRSSPGPGSAIQLLFAQLK